jgi:dynein heavy chain
MRQYEIPIADEEKENYLDMEDFFKKLKTDWQEKSEAREEIVGQLAESVQSDIRAVFIEINEVLFKVKERWLLELSTEYTDAWGFLGELMSRLIECQEKCQSFKDIQKTFKLEQTKFDRLDSVLQEVKFRQMLWESVQGWKDCLVTWNEAPFNTLDVNQIIDMNTKILRNCIFLDKKLPANDIIPQLKANAEVFKEKIPTIQCLRSSDLKPVSFGISLIEFPRMNLYQILYNSSVIG